MSTTERIKWDDWRGGDLGHLSAFEAGRRQPYRYEARDLIFDQRNNALVYRVGAARMLTVAGTSGSTCVGMGWAQSATREIWFALRNNTTGAVSIYLVVNNAATLVATLGAMAAGLAVSGVEHSGGLSFITVPGVGLFRLNHNDSAWTAIGATLGGYTVAVYGDRLYVAGGLGGVSNRVRFSDALNFTSWPALNFFDVGPGHGVRFLAAQRGHLTIALSDATWWVLNGLPNAGGVLRRVATSATQPWEFFGEAAALRGDDVVSFVPLPHDYPATFDGAGVEFEDELSINNDDISQPGAGPTRYVVRPMNDPHEVMFRAGTAPSNVLINRRKGWTRHTFGFTQGVAHFTSDKQSWAYMAGLNGADFAIYRWNYGHLQPGLSSAPATEPLSDEGASAHQARLYLPEWWHPEGADVTVRSVTVEAKGWGSDRSAPTLSCSVEALGRVDAGPLASATVAKAPGVYTGVRTFTFNFGDQGAGRGLRVLLSGIAFLSILRVTADVAVDAPRQGR